MNDRIAKHLTEASQALAAGFRNKADQKRAIENLTNGYAGLRKQLQDRALAIPEGERTEAQEALYWDLPSYPHQWKAKHADMVLRAFPCASESVERINAAVAVLVEIKAAPIAPKPESKARALERACKRNEVEGTASMIAKAVAPLKAEAVERARAATEQSLRAFADRLTGTDLAKTAPWPESNIGRAKFMVAREVHDLARRLFYVEQASYSRGAPEIAARLREDKLAKMVEQAASDAAFSFDAYVIKLEGKVGACDSAAVCGARLWQGSTLTVTKGSTVERWKTTQIVNVSVLGKVFNQWPTRLIK